MYTAKISSQGQITLPKTLRNLANLTEKATVTLSYNKSTNTITLSPQKTANELIADLHATLTPEQKHHIKQNANRPVREIVAQYWDSPEGEAELKRINHGN